ncbi:MAG: hypothetical protein IJS44_05680 [Clostridia bacterium]|nr:hypothetical protein [Clostridia bacterium]
MLYSIGGFHIDIQLVHPFLLNHLSDFKAFKSTAERADFTITVTQGDIDREFEFFDPDHTRDRTAHKNIALVELNALHRKINNMILQYGAFVMHGVLIEYEGKGYLFTAKSGTGKTTHMLLWQKAFGKENVHVINGDKPIFRLTEDGIYGYGTPWCGKEHYHTASSVKLAGILLLRRGAENHFKKIPVEEAVPFLLGQIEVENSADLQKQLEYLDRMLAAVPVYCMQCNMDVSAAETAYAGIKAEEKNANH